MYDSVDDLPFHFSTRKPPREPINFQLCGSTILDINLMLLYSALCKISGVVPVIQTRFDEGTRTLDAGGKEKNVIPCGKLS